MVPHAARADKARITLNRTWFAGPSGTLVRDRAACAASCLPLAALHLPPLPADSLKVRLGALYVVDHDRA